MRRVILLLTLLLFPSLRAAAAPALPPPPTMEELTGLFEQGKYKEVVQAIAKVVATKDAGGLDRYALLMLKGDALLHMREAGTAYDAFEAAAKATTDRKQRDTAHGLALLSRRCPKLVYTTTPKPPEKGQLIEILDPASRKTALAAMFEEELAKSKGRFDDGATAANLVPILAQTTPAANLRAIELAGGGNGSKTHRAVDPMAKKAQSLIKESLQKMDGRVKALETNANRKMKLIITDDFGATTTVDGKVGLKPPDKRELAGIQETATAAAAASQQVEEAFDLSESEAKEAERVAKYAEKVLHTRYIK